MVCRRVRKSSRISGSSTHKKAAGRHELAATHHRARLRERARDRVGQRRERFESRLQDFRFETGAQRVRERLRSHEYVERTRDRADLDERGEGDDGAHLRRTADAQCLVVEKAARLAALRLAAHRSGTRARAA